MENISKHKSIIIAIIVLLILSFAGYYYWQKSKTDTTATSIRTVAVKRGNLRSLVSATGTLKPLNIVDISSKITGRIVDVKVKENDVIKAGDVLIVLDDLQLQSELEQARAKLANIELTYNRSSKLYQDGAISKAQLDSAQMDYQVARAAWQKARDNVADTIITSPVNGEVIGKPTPAGQTVAPGVSTPMVLMQIADMSIMQIEVLVDESDIGQVKLGQKVTFTVDSYNEEQFQGVVSLISKSAVTQQNVIYYTVYVDVSDSKGKLLPSMTARADILVDESPNTLFVPLMSIRERNGEKYVQVMSKDNSGKSVTKDVNVQVGLSGDNSVEIKSGLNEGDLVVLRTAKNDATNKGGIGVGGMRPPRV